MKVHKLIYLFAVLTIVLNITLVSWACNISDGEAINSANKFCQKIGTHFSHEPWILSNNHSTRFDRDDTKDIAYGERSDFKGFITVSCKDKEVVSYVNSELNNIVKRKYKISSVTSEPHNWPQFLSESKAKEYMFAIAKIISIPSDVEFTDFGVDKENGIMIGKWVRKLNGFPYEQDRVRIEIMAVDGDLYSFNKIYHGKKCPTDVRINKEEAIREGWLQIERLFNRVDWKKQKKNYVVKSADLIIVQPNSLAGQIVRRHSKESRLAWVLVYSLKEHLNRDKLSNIGYLQNIKIKIDAGTKKFLGGDYSR